jgi:hypothetical protein
MDINNRMKLCFKILITIVISCVAVSGCSGPFSLSEAVTCRGLDANMMPVNPSKSFVATVSEINVSFKATNASRNTEIRAELFYVKGPASSMSRLASATKTVVSGTTYAGLTFTRGSIAVWPVGEYRLDIYVDGSKYLDLFFTVTN